MPEPSASPIVWDESGQPRSRLFGDIYFSRDDGLAESRAVFLTGCDLPAAWAGRGRFCVAELGFGTGLNIAALLDLWRRTRKSGQHLSIFTVEAHPLTATEAARALGAWPQIADIAALMTARWPGAARGFYRIDLPELAAVVDVAVMDAPAALSAWGGAADAWFLDGFAPAVNPAMWTPELLSLVAQRSAPGARAATFSVAGGVRRGLSAAGFAVERRPGFGTKRERLQARLTGAAAAPARAPRTAIVGAGIAGASLARAFAALGVRARVFDAALPGASVLPAALVTPRLDAGLGPQAELFAQASRRSAQLYDAVAGAVISRGAIQLESGSKDASRFAAIAASDLFEPGAMQELTAQETAASLGEGAPAGLLIDGARVIDPATVLRAWLGSVEAGPVASVAYTDNGWRLMDGAGGVLCEADVVCLAAGMACRDLAPGLELSGVRGQASWARGAGLPIAAAFGGYAIPTRDGVLFGATHDRGDDDVAPRPSDDARNLASLAAVLPVLAARLAGETLGSLAAVRATTRDYLPVAGAAPGAPAGLFALTGLGSRGFTLAPLLGEHVAALALGPPSPLPIHLQALVDPSRFATRALRRRHATRGPAERPPLGERFHAASDRD